ncbi:MAG: UDP-N-acetylmuramoyl-tripeptide--D-alanyl-D-alanine ligase [bacterium]
MKNILLEDVIKAVNGVILQNINTNDIYIKNISTDTRSISQDSLFIPIVGENFDAHDFIKDAFKLGAVCCLSEKDINNNNNNNNLIIIKVKSTREALKDLARYYISLFENLKVVALTGSAGKTTTKDMIASCLSQKYKVVKTQGNFNNEIGLPLTIFNIDDTTEIAVLEMGMNHSGEISELSKIAQPDVALITNIGYAHIENFDSIDGIFRAKYEIFDYMNPNSNILKILNADDDILATLQDIQDNQDNQDVQDNQDKTNNIYEFYGLSDSNYINNLKAFASHVQENGIDGITAKINYYNNINSLVSFDINLKYAGKHILSNTLPAVIVSDFFSLSPLEIKNGLLEFKPSKMRMDIVKPLSASYNIINDTYNANPTSMRATLDVLATCNTRKVAILGDMYELGDYTDKFHKEIGAYAINKSIDELIFIGEHSKKMLDGARDTLSKSPSSNSVSINYFKTQDDFINNLNNKDFVKQIIKQGDTILVKASRGMKLEKTVNILLEDNFNTRYLNNEF